MRHCAEHKQFQPFCNFCLLMNNTVVSDSPELADYIFPTTWSETDKEFVGLCNKYPYLSWLDAEEYKALRGIMQLAVDILTEEKKI